MAVHELKLSRSKIQMILVFAPLVLAVAFGVKKFELWSQLTYLWHVKASPITEILNLSPHSFRYALFFPVFYFSESIGIDRDIIFTLIVVVIGYFTAFLIFDSSKLISNSKNGINTSYFLICGTIVFLLFMMNGRGAVALFGYALLVNVILALEFKARFTFWVVVKIFFALLFCSVSSGTLSVSVASLMLLIFYNIIGIVERLVFMRLSKRLAIGTFFELVVFSIYISMVLVGLFKNLSFYGIGFEQSLELLQHGAGAALEPVLKVLPLAVLVVLVSTAAIGVNLFVARLYSPTLARLLIICVALGMFGYTTLAMAIVPILVLLAARLNVSNLAMRLTVN